MSRKASLSQWFSLKKMPSIFIYSRERRNQKIPLHTSPNNKKNTKANHQNKNLNKLLIIFLLGFLKSKCHNRSKETPSFTTQKSPIKPLKNLAKFLLQFNKKNYLLEIKFNKL